MDIKSGGEYPASALSNFAHHVFNLDDIQIASMEGFLQALKFSNPEIQRSVCTLVGFKAKSRGKGVDWQTTGKLHWQGLEIDRFGQGYQELLDRAYEAMCDQNEDFRKALLETGEEPLTHAIGRIKVEETILTRDEFCSRLIKMRERFKKITLENSNDKV